MSSIGIALANARDNRLAVDVLVEGHWLRGNVVQVDGFGLVLEHEASGESVIRIESIAAVTAHAEAPEMSSVMVGGTHAAVA